MRFNRSIVRLAAVNALAAGLFLPFNIPARAANAPTPPQAPLSPADAKAAAAKAMAADKAVRTAAVALQKEFAAHLAKSTAPLRTESNFFTENSNPDITAKAIIAALNRGYGSTAESLYVRWQLLSGISDTVDDANAPALLSVYRDAPAPPMRPGLDPDQKAQFRQAVLHLKESDVTNINTQFTKSVDNWETSVKPYTQYRDAIAKKLPVKYGLVFAQFRDAVERASLGVDGDETMKAAIDHCRTWASADAKPDEMQEIADDVASLLEDMGDTKLTAGPDSNPLHTVAYARPRTSFGNTGTTPNSNTAKNQAQNNAKAEPAFPPRYFTEVDWNAKAKALEWKTGSAKFASKEELVDLRKMLLEQIDKANKSKPNSAAGAA
jgi:hypothetical protein